MFYRILSARNPFLLVLLPNHQDRGLRIFFCCSGAFRGIYCADPMMNVPWLQTLSKQAADALREGIASAIWKGFLPRLDPKKTTRF